MNELLKHLFKILKSVFAICLATTLILISFSGCSASTTVSTSQTSELQNFKANIFDIEVGESQQVKFTVEVQQNENSTQSKIDLCTGDNAIGQMTDDGQNGDDIANDGIYTCLTTLSENSRKNIDYYAKSNDTKSNTFSICFYQEITEQEYSAYSTVSEEINNIENYDEALDYIKNSSDIESYDVNEKDKSISYKSKYGISGVWMSLSSDTKSGGKTTTVPDEIPSSDTTYSGLLDKIDNMTIGTYSSKKSILVIRPFRNTEFKYDDFMYAGMALAKASRGSVDVYDDTNADIDVFKSFGNYSTVLIDSHGSLSSDETAYILTGEIISDAVRSKYSADLNSGRIVDIASHLSVSSSFFNKYYSTNDLDDTSLFLGSCYSAYNNYFGDTLIQKGAPLVLGYSDAVSVTYCNETLYQFMVNDMMLNGMEASTAFSDTVKVCGESDGNAKFVMFKNGSEVNLYNLSYSTSENSVTTFSTQSNLTITLGDSDVIEPVIEPSNLTDYNIHWSSSDSSIVSVNANGNVGILNGVGAGDAEITATLVTSTNTVVETTSVHVAPASRDVVLVLDCSGSMFGEPIEEMKKVALQFCDDILNDSSENRLAIVSYDSSVYSTDLTSDISSLESNIQSMYSGSQTNLESALAEAERIMDDQGDENHTRNIIVMSDGLPNQGATSSSGSFSSTGYSYNYTEDEYANAVVDEANILMSKYNMYSMGFFHSLYGDELDFASSLMSMLTNQEDGYYQIDKAEDLKFAFGDVGETITDGSRIIVNIACPVDVQVTCNGETLSSATDSYNDEASFGNLKLLGSDNDIKVFELDSSNVYDIDFQGTDTGSMDYSVNYYDESSNLIDTRDFSNVPLNNTCNMKSSTDNSGTVSLNIDSDGDGTYDDVWEASKNSSASSVTQKKTSYTVEESNSSGVEKWQIAVISGVSGFVLVLLIVIIAITVKNDNKKKQKQELIGKGENVQIEPIPVNQVIGSSDDTVPLKKEEKLMQLTLPNTKYKISYSVKPNETYTIGKDPTWANIVLPGNLNRVSRKHCTISYNFNTNMYIVNDVSTNGVFYMNGTRLNKGMNYVQPNSNLYFADKNCYISLGG